jgi:hypothetical protein
LVLELFQIVIGIGELAAASVMVKSKHYFQALLISSETISTFAGQHGKRRWGKQPQTAQAGLQPFTIG